MPRNARLQDRRVDQLQRDVRQLHEDLYSEREDYEPLETKLNHPDLARMAEDRRLMNDPDLRDSAHQRIHCLTAILWVLINSYPYDL